MSALAIAGAIAGQSNALLSRTGASQDQALHAIDGVLPNSAAVSVEHARRECLDLPGDLAEAILAPHGDTLLNEQCRVVAYETLGRAPWAMARYTWTLEFTAEDRARGVGARDSATAEEVVLFEETSDRTVRALWHARFDTSEYAVWRSITPEIARTPRGYTLLSIMSCVNGTGGCGQDFLHRHEDGRWVAVSQAWLQELPESYRGRLNHGVRIDPTTLHGEAGFYRDGDPNCCPSELLDFDLLIRGDALLLRGSARVRKAP